MKILKSITDLRAWRATASGTLGFVPTMGALHEGHLSLVRKSKSSCERTLVSIFVNPLQFGPNEDLSKYPRDFERDEQLLAGVGADAVFFPSVEDMYPPGASTFVVEESLSRWLCGPFRPGHFRGVTTVVLKLFNLAQPTHAFFGTKDYQQVAIIERMVRDLNVPVTIVRGETVRESEGLTQGLAMSSRNQYLGKEDREKARLIHSALKAASTAFARGQRDPVQLGQMVRGILESEPAFKIQYIEVCDPATLEPAPRIGKDGAVIAVAAYLGGTRLIDNIQLK